MSEFSDRGRHNLPPIYRIPRPSRTLPRVTPEPGFQRKRLGALWLLLLIIAAIRFAPRPAPADSVPGELAGTWETSDPRYEGRYLVLTRDSLFFRAMAEDVAGYSVHRVQARQVGEGVRYTITTFSDEGGEYILSVDYRVDQQLIVLGSPADVVWRRAR